jgi:hypothetical protein
VGGAMEPQVGDGCPDHTICPGVRGLKTVLVSRMTDGSYLLVGLSSATCPLNRHQVVVGSNADHTEPT